MEKETIAQDVVAPDASIRRTISGKDARDIVYNIRICRQYLGNIEKKVEELLFGNTVIPIAPGGVIKNVK